MNGTVKAVGMAKENGYCQQTQFTTSAELIIRPARRSEEDTVAI